MFDKKGVLAREKKNTMLEIKLFWTVIKITVFFFLNN